MTDEEKELFRLLATGLVLFGVDKEDALIIMGMFYGKPDEVEALMAWMADHPKATPDDISNQVVKMLNEKTKSHSNLGQ